MLRLLSLFHQVWIARKKYLFSIYRFVPPLGPVRNVLRSRLGGGPWRGSPWVADENVQYRDRLKYVNTSEKTVTETLQNQSYRKYQIRLKKERLIGEDTFKQETTPALSRVTKPADIVRYPHRASDLQLRLNRKSTQCKHKSGNWQDAVFRYFAAI